MQAFALPLPGAGAIAGAVKIDDGGQRASFPVAVALLRALGATPPDDLGKTPVTGGYAVVGEVRPRRF